MGPTSRVPSFCAALGGGGDGALEPLWATGGGDGFVFGGGGDFAAFFGGVGFLRGERRSVSSGCLRSSWSRVGCMPRPQCVSTEQVLCGPASECLGGTTQQDTSLQRQAAPASFHRCLARTVCWLNRHAAFSVIKSWHRDYSTAHFFAFAAAALAASAALAALLTLLALLALLVFSSFRPAPPSASANPPALVCTQSSHPLSTA